MRRRHGVAAVAVTALLGALAGGCGAAAPRVEVRASTAAPTSPAPTVTAPTSTAVAPAPLRTAPRFTAHPSHEPARSTSRTTAPTTRTSTTPARKASRPTCAVPSGTTSAQVVLVDAAGSRASVRACRRSGGHYITDLGPYSGHVGKNGVSSAKREGDLRTPVGVFPLRGGFGSRPNPGLATGSWLRVDSSDVWVDDPGSSLYNTHQRLPAAGRWDSAEKLLQSPAYDYAQVIGYNEARTPGRGSAIFFHVDLGHGTAGCVSVGSAALRAVMRWESPGAVMVITR